MAFHCLFRCSLAVGTFIAIAAVLLASGSLLAEDSKANAKSNESILKSPPLPPISAFSFDKQASKESRQNSKVVMIYVSIPSQYCTMCSLYEKSLVRSQEQLGSHMSILKLNVQSSAAYDAKPGAMGTLSLTPDILAGVAKPTRDILARFGVTKVPTILHYKDGVVREMKEAPSPNSLMELAKKSLDGGARSLQTKGRKTEVMRDDTHIRVIGYYPQSRLDGSGGSMQATINSNLDRHYTAFIKSAGVMAPEGIQFFAVSDKMLARSMKLAEGEFAVIPSGERGLLHRYRGTYTANEMMKFIDEEGQALVDDIKKGMMMSIFGRGGSFLAYFYNKAGMATSTLSSDISVLKRVSKHFRTPTKEKKETKSTCDQPKSGSVCKAPKDKDSSIDNKLSDCRVISIDIGEMPELVQRYGIQPSDLPQIVFLDLSGNGGRMGMGSNTGVESFFNRSIHGYPTFRNIMKFAEQSVAGEVSRRTIKSQIEPEHNDGPVIVLTRNNWNKFVVNSDSDVFVDFYAPYCGHCMRLEPIWEELGKEFDHGFKKLSKYGVKFAKFDVSENDMPSSITVSGIPTLLYFQKGSRQKPIKFSGPRTKSDIKTWTLEHMLAVSKK